MPPHLSPVSRPKGVILRMGYWYTKRRFGQVPGPLSVFCARMPSAFTSFFGKVGKLDKKLTLSAQLATLVRQQVAAVNSCAFCMDSNRWAAINRESEAAAKLDALGDYSSSRHFDARERAALDFVTQVTQDKTSSPATFAELRRHFSEREICELTWLVASEHLYNMNNIALNIGSSGMCQTAPVEVSSAPVG
jgi:alkylhydroperoxidase family enzyme